MKTIVILAMHGISPRDFPAADKKEYFRLRSKLGEGPFADPKTDEQKRYEELEHKIRNWPRNPENDPFAAASCALAGALKERLGLEVLVGFNEFCAPDLNQVIDMAVEKEADRLVVTTPMVTRGGHHSEEEIPELIEAAKKQHSHVEFIYAWPYEDRRIAEFLAGHIESKLPKGNAQKWDDLNR